MKKSKFGARILALVLTLIMVISIVPVSTWAAVHDITTGNYRGTVGVDLNSLGNNGEINWPVKIYDYHSDSMLFEYASSWMMDGSLSLEGTIAEKSGILYGGGAPMPVTELGTDYTGIKAYSNYCYTDLNTSSAGNGTNYTIAHRNTTTPHYVRLSPKSDTALSGKANNFYVTDFEQEHGGQVAKNDARYMVIAYSCRGLDLEEPFSVAVLDDTGTFRRAILDSSYGVKNGTSTWRYVVIDLKALLGNTKWNAMTTFHRVLLSVKLETTATSGASSVDLFSMSHVAYFDNKDEAERYGQKAIAFDNNPGEYLGTTSYDANNQGDNNWNLGNNLAYGLLMASSGGGWNYYLGGESVDTDTGYKTYRIGYTPYGDNGSSEWTANYHRTDSSGNNIGNTNKIYYVEGDTFAANADYQAKYPNDYKNGFNTADLEFDGYDLLTHVTSGQISMGLLEGELVNGRPVYRQETVEYLADVIRKTLPIPQKAPNGDYNYNFLSGTKSAATYGTDSSGNALDLPQALRNQLGVTFTEGNRRGTTPTLGKYSTTVEKAGKLTGAFTDCIDDIASCMDAAYYLLNNLFVTNSYNQLQDDFRYLTFTGAESDDYPDQTVYVFDAGFTNGARNQKDNPLSGLTQEEYKEVSQSAVDYSSYHKGGNGTISLGNIDAKDLFYYAYDENNLGEGYTTRFPFLPVVDAEGDFAGETESYYFLEDGYRSNKFEFDTYANRNFNYVLASNGEFVYNQEDDLFFQFEGDDDVYLFINDQLVLDLGGAHPISAAKFNVNDYVKWAQKVLEDPDNYTEAEVKRAHALDLEDGEIAKFDFFYMERHGYGANMRIMTNMRITDPDMRVEKQAFQGNKEIEYGGIIDGEYPVEYNFTLKNSGNTKLYNLSFDDADIGIKLNHTDGLLVTGDDTETDTDDINGYYVTDARGKRLDPQDLTAIVKGYEPVDSGGDYLLVGDEYQKVEDGSGTHKYTEITVNFNNNAELKSFLRTLEGDGLDDSTIDDELTQTGSGLWVDASVTFKGIYYNLTSEQKNVGVFNNTVYVSATTKSDPSKTGCETLRSEDNHRVYLTAIPLFYQWAGHNLFIPYQVVLDDASAESANKGSMLNDYKAFFDAVGGDISKIVMNISDRDGVIKGNNYYEHVARERNPKDSLLGFRTSYPEVGTYEFYVTMRLSEYKSTEITNLNKDEYAIVRILVFVTDVEDSTFVLDYGLKTENLDANGELFKNDELLGATSGVEAKLMAFTDGSNGIPYYRDPNNYTNYNRITFKKTELPDDKRIIVNGEDGNADGYFTANLEVGDEGKKITYDKYSQTYSMTESGTTTVHVEAPPAWETLYLYYWYDNGVNNIWPGTPMNKTSTGSSSLAIPGNVPHIIISNGANQTVDLSINPGEEIWVDINGDVNSEGKLLAGVKYKTKDGTIHATVPDGWGDVYVYCWDMFNNEVAPWPGTKIDSVDSNGYYSITIPGDITNFIVNNGSEETTQNRKQTIDQTVAAGKESWVVVDDEPTQESAGQNPEYYNAVVSLSTEKVKMHVTVPDNWPTAYLYYWNSNGSATGLTWPGLEMTKDAATGIYTMEVPADVQHVVVSDGNFRQTENIDVTAGLEAWITVHTLTSTTTMSANVPSDWGKAYFYYFYNDGTSSKEVAGSWPGTAGTQMTATRFRSAVPPYATHVVITNADGSKQTANIPISAGTTNEITVLGAETQVRVKTDISNPHIYYWKDGTNNGWPGTPLTTKDSEGYYNVVIPSDYVGNVIINNNSDRQTEDLGITAGVITTFEVLENEGYEKYAVTNWETSPLYTSNITEVVRPATKTTANVSYGMDAEAEGFSFTPVDFMDSEYNLWIALTVHENDWTPTPLMNNINIGKEVQMYKKVTVLPANVVYYEDNFAGIKYTDNEDTENVITHYISGTGSLTQSVDQNQQYGNDNAYQGSENGEMTGGSLTDIYINENTEFASFNFTGTGFEIIGHTHAEDSGTLMVEVYDENGNRIKRVPVISEFDNGADGGPDSIVSVPIVRVSGLAHGKYKVVLVGVPLLDFTQKDENGKWLIDTSYLCIDGVRVYQPLITDEIPGSHEAYIDKENGAAFTEVRDLVADRKAFAVRYTDNDGLSVSGGTNTWIENRNNYLPSDSGYSWTSKNVNSVNDYLLAGPNNELYLLESTDEEKSAVAFYVTETSGAAVRDMQIGVRAVDYNAYMGNGASGLLHAEIQYGAMEDGKLVWKHLTTSVSSSEQYFTIPYTECPYDKDLDRYQVVLRVADTDVTGMASFTSLKYNGLELNVLNTSEVPDIVYDDEIYTDIMDSQGNSLDSSKFVNFIQIADQMQTDAVAGEGTTTNTTLNGTYSYNQFKSIVDSCTGKSSYNYQLTEKTRLYIVSETTPSEELLDTIRLVQSQFAADGYTMDVVWGKESNAETGDILIKENATCTAEQYKLTVTDSALIEASDMRGFLYGLNALQKHFRMASDYIEANPTTSRTPDTIKGFVITDAPDTAERTVHLDCGRKYFTKEWICNYIREMSWMGYNALELHFSEDGGFRIDFWDNTTDFVSPTGNDFSWVCGGHKPSFNTQADDAGYDYTQYLTAAEVKEICEVAKQYHIDIIPSFDTPAHVSWLTTAYNKQGDSTFRYDGTQYTLPSVINYRNSYSLDNSACLQLGNDNVQKFAFAMYTDIAAFFKQYAGSTEFNICGDEVVLSDKATDGWDYADFVDYVNNLNTLLKDQGYKVRMYNDFAHRDDYASKASRTVADLASDIEIIFWDGPDSSTAAIKSAAHWVNDSRNIYSGNQYWTYYVLHRMDNPASKTWLSENGYWNMDTRNPACDIMCYTRNGEDAVYAEWDPTVLYDYGKTAYTYSGSQLAGGYFMIWCNYAALNTEVEMWDNVTDVYHSQVYSLRERMWSNAIKQWNTDVDSTVTFADFEKARDYMGDFPGLDESAGGISRPAKLTAGKEAYGPIATKYTVTFKDYDGTVISVQKVPEGQSATAPASPTRLPDGNYTYLFAGWDTDFAVVSSDLVVTAMYTESVIVDAMGKLEIKLSGGNNVYMTVGDGGSRPMGQSFSTTAMPYGTRITLTAFSSDEKQFIGWVNAITGSLLSSSETYTFYTSGNDILLAVFETTVESMSVVTFKNNKTGQIVDMQYYNSTDKSVNFPDDLTCPGYEFIGWNLTESQIVAKLAAGENVTVLPVWNIKDKFVSVTVNGGKITDYELRNEEGMYVAYKGTTVTAGKAPAGKQFAYWEDATGKIVSYDEVYKFYPCEDTTLTAVYSADNVNYKILTNLYVDSGTYGDSNTAVFSWSIPEQTGYTFVNAGLLLVEEENYVESEFKLDSINPDITIFTPGSKYQTSTGTHALSQNVAAGSVWKIKVFVQYRDLNGNLRTVYSDTVTAQK